MSVSNKEFRCSECGEGAEKGVQTLWRYEGRWYCELCIEEIRERKEIARDE